MTADAAQSTIDIRNALFERAELFGAANLEVLVDGGWGNV